MSQDLKLKRFADRDRMRVMSKKSTISLLPTVNVDRSSLFFAVISLQAWCKPGRVWLCGCAKVVWKQWPHPLFLWKSCSKMTRSMSALSSASRGSVIRQRTVAELRRKAPRLHTMIYSLGFPQKQEISHRVERSRHYSCVWRHVKPHMILIKSCKCAVAIMFMFFVLTSNVFVFDNFLIHLHCCVRFMHSWIRCILGCVRSLS